jgi:hypothetical protein
MQVVIPRADTAYLHLFRPQAAMEAGKPDQYSATFLWDEDNKKLDKLRQAIIDVATAKFGAKAKAMLEKRQLNSPLRPGSDKEDAKDAELYEGKVFLKASSTDKPQVVDEDLEPVMDQMAVYSGCQGRGDIWLFAYDKAGNKGVGAILNSFQKLGEGERRSGRRPAADAFSGVDDDDDEENLV